MDKGRKKLKEKVEYLLEEFSGMKCNNIDTSRLSNDDLRLASYILEAAHTYVEAAIKEVKRTETKENFDETIKTYIIKESVTHQDIGGKILMVDDRDQRITDTLTKDMVISNALEGNFACMNFIERRQDFDPESILDFPHKLYYGHVGGLGYVVAEDEIEEVL